MYEKDGERYFVVDSHLHFWDASPENWVKGQEQYAKGWIECFHAYKGLGPPETHWPIEKFMKYSEEDFVKDVFEEGDVDVGVFQSTYLKEWYTDGLQHGRAQRPHAAKFPDKLIVNGRWDPREGEAGLEQLEEDAKRYNLKGVKLYTAEWYNGSRGWRLEDDQSKPFLEKCEELGITNIHVHKGPTIWPLDKDAFDVSDVDEAATDNPELNFIVEHVGLPRIEDFCFMATQEPNVYAGLAVVIGGLMHARPRFFAKVMGELLFWVGEDKMLFGSDYGIWEPKWQIEGFLDWDYPDDDATRTTRAWASRARRRSSASTRPSCTASRSRRSCGCPDDEEPAAQEDAQLVEVGMTHPRRRPGRARARSMTRSWTSRSPTLRFVGLCEVRRRGRDGALRLPTPQCAPNFAFLMAADARAAVRGVPGVREVGVTLEDHYTGARSTPPSGAAAAFAGAFPGETEGDLGGAARAVPAQGAVARQARVCEALLEGGATPAELSAMRVADLPDGRARDAAAELRARAGHRRGRGAAAFVAGDGDADRRGAERGCGSRGWRR